MEKHKKHGANPHDKHAAMPQFNEGHWAKSPGDVMEAGGKYSAEMNQAAEYKKSVDGLASYVKNHRAQH